MNLFGCGGPLRPTKKYCTSIRLGRANPLVSIGECQGLVCVVVGDEFALLSGTILCCCQGRI